jgi:hypothetical protein
VDVLVTFAKDARPTLDAWVEIREDLATMFGREVDLIERNGLAFMRNYLRREEILTSAVLLDVA